MEEREGKFRSEEMHVFFPKRYDLYHVYISYIIHSETEGDRTKELRREARGGIYIYIYIDILW